MSIFGRRGEHAGGYFAERDGDSGGYCLRLRRHGDGRTAGDGRKQLFVLRDEFRLWRSGQPGNFGADIACADCDERNLRADAGAVAGLAVSPGAGDGAGARPRLVAGELERDHPESSSGGGGLCRVSVMHEIDPTGCVPVAICYSNHGAVDPSLPKVDDQAALSRLYPVTAQNLGNFPGKQIFSQATARIHGSVYFTDASGAAAQPMQGVNVVARWIDPATHQPSGAVAVSSVSGFSFVGNAGNVITGYTDATGLNFDRFGSDDQTLEGFFDLAGLQIPNGATRAQYQISVERYRSAVVGECGALRIDVAGAAVRTGAAICRQRHARGSIAAGHSDAGRVRCRSSSGMRRPRMPSRYRYRLRGIGRVC